MNRNVHPGNALPNVRSFRGSYPHRELYGWRRAGWLGCSNTFHWELDCHYWPLKWLKLQVDGTASLMPFVNHPDYLLSGTFDCTGGIAHLRFILPYCRDAGPENPGLFYHSKYEAHLEEDELVICQTVSLGTAGNLISAVGRSRQRLKVHSR
jgi:hypothetical protein